MEPKQRAEMARVARDLLTSAAELAAEVERRRMIESADEFVGRIGPFEIEGVFSGKAGEEDGLMIEGIASNWSPDREGDAFAPGAFDRGIENFMRNPILVYSHSKPLFETVKGENGYLQLGIVKEMRKDPMRGLIIRAFVRKPPVGSGFLEHVYEQIKSGEMRGLSVGGKFKSLLGKIVEADLTEISIAPRPVNKSTLITRVTPVSQAGVE